MQAIAEERHVPAADSAFLQIFLWSVANNNTTYWSVDMSLRMTC